jgi:DNA (cytosine-5)-methyltransferase 1
MKMLSLFSGIGGIDLAAEWAGIETVAFCEIDPYCQKVLKKHWPDVPIYSDIRELRGDMVGSIDIVAGGFPCQPFSTAGKQRSKEDDRYLWPEMLRIIQELRPTWIVGENVPGIINLALDDVLLSLETEGYTTQTFVIPACGINAPHLRNRVFLVAHSGGRGLREQNICEKQQGRTETIGTGEDVSYSESGRFTKHITGRSKTRGFSGSSWWSVEPNVGRVAYGVPNRMDRLKSLGNAVVPQQIYPIFKAIMEVSQ